MLPSLQVSTALLYGIFVSRKSYEVGFRNLTKSLHAKMLVNKVVGDRLPQELTDVIIDALIELERAEVNAMWKHMKAVRHEWTVSVGTSTPAMVEAQSLIGSHGLLFTAVGASLPFSQIKSGEEKGHSSYVHLSAGGKAAQPALTWSLPHGSVIQRMNGSGQSAIATLSYELDKGNLYTSLSASWTMGPNSDCLHPTKDCVIYRPDLAKWSNLAKPGSTSTAPAQTSGRMRLMTCDNVERSMQEWDGEMARKLINLLDLQVISTTGEEGDGLMPRLRLWQIFEEK